MAWVVEHEGSVVGAMLLSIAAISHLVVSNEHRRVGVGSMLIAKAKAQRAPAAGDELKAEVTPQNQPMISLLLKEGFVYEPLHYATSESPFGKSLNG